MFQDVGGGVDSDMVEEETESGGGGEGGGVGSLDLDLFLWEARIGGAHIGLMKT